MCENFCNCKNFISPNNFDYLCGLHCLLPPIQADSGKKFIFLVFLFDCTQLGLYNYLTRLGLPGALFMVAFNWCCTGRVWGLKISASHHHFDGFTPWFVFFFVHQYANTDNAASSDKYKLLRLHSDFWFPLNKPKCVIANIICILNIRLKLFTSSNSQFTHRYWSTFKLISNLFSIRK